MIDMFLFWQQCVYDQIVVVLDVGCLGYGLFICGLVGLGKCVVVLCFVEYVFGCGELVVVKCSVQLIVVGIYLDLQLILFIFNKFGDKLCIEIVIEQVCEILQKLVFILQYGIVQVVIVDLVDVINCVVCNVLFKIFEELQFGCYLWLISSDLVCLLVIVCSCCQWLEFKLLLCEEVLVWLQVQGYSDVSVCEVFDVVCGYFGLVDDWLCEDGLVLCCQVVIDLELLVVGCVGVVELVQCWIGDEYGVLCLCYVVDFVLVQVVGGGLIDLD